MASKIKFHHHEPMIATLSNPSPGAGIHRQLVTAVSTIDHPNRYQSPAPPPTMDNLSFPSLTGFPLSIRWSVGMVRSRRFTMPVKEGEAHVWCGDSGARIQ